MKLINKKRKLIFEFENTETGILVTTKVKGKLKLNDILCAQQMMDNKLKEYDKDKRK